MASPYLSLSSQVASNLRDQLRTGRLGDQLPGERQLAERLAVSRKTIRKALEILRSEGIVRTRSNRSSRVAKARVAKAGAVPRKIVLLLPAPIEGARPFTVLWVNHLMALLHEAGLELEVVSGAKYFGHQASRSLSRLVETKGAACWILARSHRAMQQWFHDHEIPAIVAGSSHPGIDLPSVDIDHHALCRHAAITFLQHGHTRLALFLEKAGHRGDDESERGFREGLAGQPGAGAPLVCRPDKDPASISRAVERLHQLPNSPTGYLLSNSFSYLTVFSYFASCGLRVPDDVSLISRDEEPFLAYLKPVPTRYSIAPAKYALPLFQAIRRVLTREAPRHFEVQIIPDFIKGASLKKL